MAVTGLRVLAFFSSWASRRSVVLQYHFLFLSLSLCVPAFAASHMLQVCMSVFGGQRTSFAVSPQETGLLADLKFSK